MHKCICVIIHYSFTYVPISLFIIAIFWNYLSFKVIHYLQESFPNFIGKGKCQFDPKSQLCSFCTKNTKLLTCTSFIVTQKKCITDPACQKSTTFQRPPIPQTLSKILNSKSPSANYLSRSAKHSRERSTTQ